MIDPVANEAACRHLTAEIGRLQLMLAQAVGNLALVNKQLAEARAELAERDDTPNNDETTRAHNVGADPDSGTP